MDSVKKGTICISEQHYMNFSGNGQLPAIHFPISPFDPFS